MGNQHFASCIKYKHPLLLANIYIVYSNVPYICSWQHMYNAGEINVKGGGTPIQGGIIAADCV